MFQDLDQVVSLSQVLPDKIKNFKAVAGIMNGIKIRKSENKILSEIKSGLLANKIMNIPLVSDSILQESDDEEDIFKQNSLAEREELKSHEAKIKEQSCNEDLRRFWWSAQQNVY